MPSTTVIVNATAGTAAAAERLEELRQVLASRNGIKTFEAKKGEDLPKLVDEAMASSSPTIVAVGGDGTISSVACALAAGDASKALGVIPFGTLNHFARDNKIPIDIGEALSCIESGKSVNVDVAEVNGQYFINNSSIGMYPKMVAIRDHAEAKGMSKIFANLRAIFTVLKRTKYLTVRLDVDGNSITRRTPLVFVGNNRYIFQGSRMGQRERLDEGLLSVFVPHSISRPGLVWLAIRALLGLERGARELDHFEVQKLTVDTPQANVLVSCDGEVREMRSPLKYQIHPKALRLIVP